MTKRQYISFALFSAWLSEGWSFEKDAEDYPSTDFGQEEAPPGSGWGKKSALESYAGGGGGGTYKDQEEEEADSAHGALSKRARVTASKALGPKEMFILTDEVLTNEQVLEQSGAGTLSDPHNLLRELQKKTDYEQLRTLQKNSIKAVQSFVLRGLMDSSRKISVLHRWIEKMEALKVLCIEKKCTRHNLIELLKAIEKKSLWNLYLCGKWFKCSSAKQKTFRAEAVKELSNYINSINSSVRALSFVDMDIGENIRELAAPLSQIRNLKELNLYANNLGQDPTHSLAKALRNHKKLIWLNIASNGFSSEAMYEICARLKESLKMKRLFIGGNAIKTSKAAKSLAKMLQDFHKLEKLDISDMQMPEKCLITFLKTLHTPTMWKLALTRLDFSGNNAAITNPKVASFISSLARLERLSIDLFRESDTYTEQDIILNFLSWLSPLNKCFFLNELRIPQLAKRTSKKTQDRLRELLRETAPKIKLLFE